MKLLLLILIIAIISVVIYKEHNSEPKGEQINNNTAKETNIHSNKIQNFKFNIINQNNIINLYDIKSNKIIIHFWASWCHVCTKEFNSIINYAKTHPNVNILAISIDDDKPSLDQYLNILYKNNYLKSLNNLLFIWDQDKSISMSIFNNNMVPENYVLNNNYEVIDKLIGEIDWDSEL